MLLDVHDPANCSTVVQQPVTNSTTNPQGGFGFSCHYCNVDDVDDAKIAACSCFAAGLRIFDIHDPVNPKEIGYFIPSITEATDKRCVKVDGQDRCKVAIQTNNVETDDRGYVYIVDRANTGMHILELTGDARAVAGLP